MRENVTFHGTFISHTQIGWKLENILNKLLEKHTVHILHQTFYMYYVRPLKNTTIHLSMFLNKDTPCSRGNEVIQKKSRDMLDVVKKRDCFLVCFVKILDILYNVSYCNNIKRSGKYSSDFVQNFAEKNTGVLLCSANAWIRTHAMFPMIPKWCCCFSVVQSF